MDDKLKTTPNIERSRVPLLYHILKPLNDEALSLKRGFQTAPGLFAHPVVPYLFNYKFEELKFPNLDYI